MFKNCKFCKGKLIDTIIGECVKCDARHFREGSSFYINFEIIHNNIDYYVDYKYERKNKISMEVSRGPIHGAAMKYKFILSMEGLDKFELTPQNFSKRIDVLVLFS